MKYLSTWNNEETEIELKSTTVSYSNHKHEKQVELRTTENHYPITNIFFANVLINNIICSNKKKMESDVEFWSVPRACVFYNINWCQCVFHVSFFFDPHAYIRAYTHINILTYSNMALEHSNIRSFRRLALIFINTIPR